MAHFAKIEDGVVTKVIVINNEDVENEDGVEQEFVGIAFCKNLFGNDTTWIQTSYNNNFRKRYAGLGYTYDSEKDIFIKPQPYPSWSLDAEGDWQAPVVKPDDFTGEDGLFKYVWDEPTMSWVEVD
tara:strand:+ start:889 stop:1266 length:378 start_codon:yes stop_codon:yes gene_type:complete